MQEFELSATMVRSTSIGSAIQALVSVRHLRWNEDRRSVPPDLCRPLEALFADFGLCRTRRHQMQPREPARSANDDCSPSPLTTSGEIIKS
jgi:hypothetical protein